MITDDLKGQLLEVKTIEDIHEAWDVLKRRYKELQARIAISFKVGDDVTFQARGMEKKGKVTKVNQKTCSVLVGEHERWKVHASNLKKVGA
jgi:hypothetical protein